MKLRRLAGRRLAAGALATATIAALAASAQGGATAAPSGETALYIVQTTSEPAAQYKGTVAGYAKTKPSEGARLDARSAAVRNWVNKLRGEHDATLNNARVGSGRKVYDYGLTFNGYAARLTTAEAARLKGTKGVLSVWKDEIVSADTTTTRDFLGLSGKFGVWNQQFKGNARAGEGVIVGVVDSGIWPESQSFAPLVNPADQAIIDAKWSGTCDVGVEEPVACNNKLIGARYYHAGVTLAPFEFDSPRGFSGHGTHTASTAAGNFGVPASINGFDLGTTSGMAPAARVAVYKGLWAVADPVTGLPTGQSSGSSVDLAAAIEQAVADGVDVINYSISGSPTSIIRPTDIQFFNAAAAGVFVAASAGNDGAVSTVNHNFPWVTTVAASTHNRGNLKTVSLGNGASYTGVGVVPPAVGTTGLVNAESIPAAGFTAAQSRLCLLNSINAAAAAGKIVICTRGSNDRVQKSQVVKNAGGVGMVHANSSTAESLNGDWHIIPTVHLNATDGNLVKAYAASAGASATASISVTNTNPVVAPAMAGFSSYGPALAGGGDLLKPDITAPGVDVIASVAPPGHGGKNFDGLSGTSMAAPHIAGIAALIKSKNPSWSPMWIKSAMMTTASTKDSAGNTIQHPLGTATPLNFGAGHIVAGSAFDPGLVYDSTPADWIKYGCALGQFQAITDCSASLGTDPSNLNYPSIAVGDLAGKQTVIRTVTNADRHVGIYQAKVTAPAGFTATVSPEWLIIPRGKSATYKVTLTRTTATFGQFSFGSIVLDEFITGRHLVTSPIAVRPVPFAAAPESRGTGTSGSATLNSTPGYTGTLTASVAGGLTASAVSDLAFTATNTNFNVGAPAESDSVKKVTVTVPAGSVLARFATYDDQAPAGTDSDMHVYLGGTNTRVAASAGGTNEEIVTLTAAGTYDIYVVMFAHTTPTPPVVKFHGFVVPATAAGNLTATPASQSVTTGVTAPVTGSWTGLTAGLRYLGVVTYGDGTATLGRTIFGVNG